jgi:exosortase A
MVAVWIESTTYTHCFFVAPLAAYLAWERRDYLKQIAPQGSVAGLVLVVPGSLVWFLGAISGSMAVAETAFIGLFAGAVVVTLGGAVARALAFPLFYLVFAVPFGEALIPHLQAITAAITVVLLTLSGVPVASDDLLIVVPNGSWEVAEACSGIRFLIASVAVGALLSYMFLSTWRRRATFMVLSVLIPVLANGIRAYGIVLIGYLTNNELAAGVDHIVYGWVFFSIIIVLMVVTAVALRQESAGPLSRIDRPHPRGQRVAAPRGRYAPALALLCIVAGLRLLAASIDAAPAAPVSMGTFAPMAEPPWTLATGVEDFMPPVFAGTDRTWHLVYQRVNARVYLSVGYVGAERPGAEVATTGHRFASGEAPLISNIGTVNLAVRGQDVRAKILEFDLGERRRLLCYWYWVDGSFTGNSYIAKVWQLAAKLGYGRRDAAVLSLAVDYVKDRNAAMATLADLAGNLPTLKRDLEQIALR